MSHLTITSEEITQKTIDRFWETVPPVWNRIRANIHLIITNHFDITVEQFHILRQIRRGVASVSELADLQQISRSGMSQAVDILVEKGLIGRHEDPKDRRYVQLELTRKGNELLNAIFERNRAWMAGELSGLDSTEMDSIINGMEALKKSFIPADR